MALTYITEAESARALGAYSFAVIPEVGARLIAASGVIGNIGRDIVPGGLLAQFYQGVENGFTVLRAAGIQNPRERIAEASIFLADVARFAEIDEAYRNVFSEGDLNYAKFPARMVIQAQPPLGAEIEMKFQAYLPPAEQICDNCLSPVILS